MTPETHKKMISQARNESKKALSKLIENYGRLAESKRTQKMGRAIVKEAIIFERLTLLEAAGQDVHHMAEMMMGMKMSARLLVKRLGLAGLEIWLDSVRTPSNEELDAMFIRKDLLKAFMRQFADVAAVTKGLLALSNDLGETQGGMGGPLGEIIKSLQGGAPTAANSDQPLRNVMNAYDMGVNRMKKPKSMDSLTDRIKSRLGFGKKSSGSFPSHNSEAKFKAAVDSILRTKSPAAVKLINPQEMTQALMNQPIKQIVRAFRAYPASVTHYVDDDMLMALSKGPAGVMGILKGLADMFQNGAPSPTRG